MPFELDRFCASRPYLYHLTAASNRPRIQRTEQLCSAAVLFGDSSSPGQCLVRRRAHELITIDGDVVVIRDQSPLHPGHIEFDPGWDMTRLVAHINEHVFFWPGTAAGPIRPGLNHFERYRGEELALLRVPSRDVVACPQGGQALFCRYNSGAPRAVMGQRSPRGAGTYVPSAAFPGAASDVKEIVFKRVLVLPRTAEIAGSYEGPWQPLFGVE